MALARNVVRVPDRIRAQAPLLKRLSQRVRSRHLFALDVLGLVVAVLIALGAAVNHLPDGGVIGAYVWIAGILVCTHIVANILIGLYTNSWRYASIGDMGRIIACTFAGTTAAALIVSGLAILEPPTAVQLPPPSFWLLEAMLALGVFATPRYVIRAASDLSDHSGGHHDRQRTLLYGAGWAGVMAARSAERSPATGVAPVGFLDDNLHLKGRRVNGLHVFGDTSAMGRAKRETGATALLITMPRAGGNNVRRVVEAAMHHGLEVRTVPAMTDLIDGTIDASHTRRVAVEDLLRRPPATEHSAALKQLLEGRTVMITGAAGSIGSELVRQVLLLGPSRIVMVDQAESAMYMAARDLETRSQVADGTTRITTHLVDVTDRDAVGKLMCETSPVVVFHAAAYKHVPMLEDHAAQAVRVNMGGTQSVVDAAIDCGVQRFVLVSTDKAVRPSSVMGASKRVAEMIVAEAAQRTGRAFVSVRFGNVLGSNGSVIPVFQSQLENGQPLTVTDAEMTRYFMTIPEASWLILDAAALSGEGGLYVLDMGEPVRILDVANDLIRLSGRDPDSVPIRFVGLRPGEKLHEELFYENEQVAPTDVPKVMRCKAGPERPVTLGPTLARWLSLARDGRNELLKVELLAFVLGEDEDAEIAVTLAARRAANGYRPAVPLAVGGDGNGRHGGTGTNDKGAEQRVVIKSHAAIPITPEHIPDGAEATGSEAARE